MAALVAVTVVAPSGWIADAPASSLRVDPLVATGQLLASDAPIPLGPSAVSGRTVVVVGSAYIGGHSQGVVYVFTQPAGGWSGTRKPTAMLVDSRGRGLDDVAISGRTVVATADYGADVFTEPARGWSGVVHESARLTASDAAKSGGLAGVAIDGPTIVARTYDSSSSPGEAYVFTEPERGWSGKLHQSAKLLASGGADGDGFGSSVAVSGQTIAVSAPYADFAPGRPGGGRVYVFTRPAMGWSGSLYQSATLSASTSDVALNSDSIAVRGNTVFATAAAPGVAGDAYVFTEPAGGWSGSLHETAVLSASDGALSGPNSLAASDGTLVAGGGSAAYVFTEPAGGGWANATETAKLTPAQGGAAGWVDISGQTVVAGPGTVADVFVEPAAGWSSIGQPTATLGVNGPSGQNLFRSVAMSNGTAVAGAPGATIGANQGQGAAYVFTEPAGGWSTETEKAKLVESDGQAGDSFGGLVATSGGTIVVARSASRGTALYVFTEPPGGWSGTLHQSAQLTVADPGAGVLTSVAISGNRIVAGTMGAGAAAYVFTEPGGGWSGTIRESARLVASDGSNPCFDGLDAVAIDRNTVVAGSTSGSSCNPGVAYVFMEPASGWSGTLQESARLAVPSDGGVQSVAAAESTVVAVGGSYKDAVDPVVFNEPVGGWSGTIHPAARLKLSATGAGPFAELVVSSGDEIAAAVVPETDVCASLPTSCGGTLYAFSQPHGGWTGTIGGASKTVGPPSGYPLAIAGHTTATEGVGGIDLFTAQPGPPFSRKVSLSGLAYARPRLRFTLDAGQGAAPIRSFELSLPTGLRFASGRAGLPTGVHVTVPRLTVRIRNRTLTATLRRPVENLSATIASPALIERQKLIAETHRIRRYNRTHTRKQVLTVRIRCFLTDAAGRMTPLALVIRIS